MLSFMTVVKHFDGKKNKILVFENNHLAKHSNRHFALTGKPITIHTFTVVTDSEDSSAPQSLA